MKKNEPQKTTQKKVEQTIEQNTFCKFHKNYKEQQFQKYHDLYRTL